jgi:hypothetical protein
MILFAYVDPGSGALIWQAIVAGAIGCLFYVRKTRDFLARVPTKLLRLLKPPGGKGPKRE